jgi:sugar/nucleoside kinase (ribokinase family)
VAGAVRPGGAALYAAVTADRLGLAAGLLTSHGDDFPLDAIPPRIEVVSVPAGRTTRFEHAATEETRVLSVGAAARPLGPADVPGDWLDASIVLLAPVLGEVDPLLAGAFPDGAVAASAQGWLRGVGADARVVPQPWSGPELVLAKIQALFLSREDIRGQEEAVLGWMERVPLGVLTADRDGALLFVNDQRYEVRPRPAAEVDPTGAGDVFAATFLVEYRRHGDPWRAAAAAACAGSLAVEGEGWATVPDRAALDAALADYALAD